MSARLRSRRVGSLTCSRPTLAASPFSSQLDEAWHGGTGSGVAAAWQWHYGPRDGLPTVR